uniref:N-acetyltransferase domain-containing protein n=1 Tax=Leersia perrieri TaxID=77586 RepID=A0A0D9XSJ6_9ORYZ
MSAVTELGETSAGGGEGEITYVSYGGEHHLPLVMSLVDEELSEPYSIFTYRYFVYLWPQLTFLAFDPKDGKCVGTVVCKMGEHRGSFRGYIAMLVVLKPYRGRGIATELVTRSIRVMMESGCEEVTLEAEVTNKGALALYGRLGFIRAKRLYRYYLNGVDAFRLKLLFPRPDPSLHPMMLGNERDDQHMDSPYLFAVTLVTLLCLKVTYLTWHVFLSIHVRLMKKHVLPLHVFINWHYRMKNSNCM